LGNIYFPKAKEIRKKPASEKYVFCKKDCEIEGRKDISIEDTDLSAKFSHGR